jgi:hypothetical protein
MVNTPLSGFINRAGALNFNQKTQAINRLLLPKVVSYKFGVL